MAQDKEIGCTISDHREIHRYIYTYIYKGVGWN